MNLLSRAFPRAAFVVATAALGASSFAVIDSTPPGDLAFVGIVNGTAQFPGSGVAVGKRLYLTANHVGPHTFTLGGIDYGVVSYVNAPDYVDPLNPSHKAHTDLTLVTVDQDLPGWYDVGTTFVGDAVTMVGYGRDGVVSGDNKGYSQQGSFGTRHSGSGSVADSASYPERTSNVAYDSSAGAHDGLGPYRLSYLKTAGDGIVTGGDSGGGWFSGGALVGITSFNFNLTDPDGAGPTSPLYRDYGFGSANATGFNYDNGDGTGSHFYASGTAYTGSGAIDLTDPQIRTWLQSNGVNVVPEPGTLAAFGLGAAAMLRRRRRKA